MEFREIVSVTGMPGLFQLVATKSDGAIVRNLADKTAKFIPARTHQVTPLDSIEIYTHNNNLKLNEVLNRLDSYVAEHPIPDVKGDQNLIKKYFEEVIPEYDQDRVYVSDMKKVFRWYEVLKANDLIKPDGKAGTESDNEEHNDEDEGTKTLHQTVEAEKDAAQTADEKVAEMETAGGDEAADEG